MLSRFQCCAGRFHPPRLETVPVMDSPAALAEWVCNPFSVERQGAGCPGGGQGGELQPPTRGQGKAIAGHILCPSSRAQGRPAGAAPCMASHEGAWVYPAHTHVAAPLTGRAAHGCCPRHCTLSVDGPSPCLVLGGRRCTGAWCRISAGPELECCHTGPQRGDTGCVLPKSFHGSLSQAQGPDQDQTPGEMPEGAHCKPDSLGASTRGRMRTRGRCCSCRAPYRRKEGPKPLQRGPSHSHRGVSQERLILRAFEAMTLQPCPRQAA